MGKVLKAVAIIAVAVAVAYFAPALLPGLIGSGALATAVTAAVVSTAVAVAASAAISVFARKPSALEAGPPGVFRQAIANSFIVYGKRLVGGLLIFFHPRVVGKDHYRYFVIAVAGHQCKGVVQWVLSDDVVSVDGAGKVISGTYANNAWLWFYRGDVGQIAHPTFVAETDGKWTSAHRGQGTALIYAKFKMTDDVVQAGMPVIRVEIEGKDDILDVRTGERGYTRNAQLIFRDFLAMPREEGGFGCYPDELDDDWDSAQANVCDEAVPLKAGGTEPRYAFDCYITTGAAPSEVRDTFVTCCAGAFTYSGGKMLMRPGYYVPPSATLQEDDLAGPITVPAMLAGDQVATEVTGTFIDPSALYQPADAPTRSVPSDDIRQISIDMPHVTSGTMGQRVMEIALRKAQAERRVTWPMNIMGIAISPLDTVQLATARYGLSNYAFQTVGWGLSQDFSVVVQLEETGPEIFEWSADMELAVGQGGTLVKADPIGDAPAGRAAYQIIAQSVPYPVTSTSDSIAIQAFNGTLDDGRVVPFAPTTLTGLTPATAYVVLRDLTTLAYSAVLAPAIEQVASSANVIVRYVTTSDTDGTYPPETTPPGGDGGGGYGGGRYPNEQIQ